MPIERRRRAGNTTTSLLLLLVILLGAGGYNYWRNLEIEKQQDRPRPFRSYATEDLTALRDAYRHEIETAERRFSAQQQRRVRASGEGLIDARVDEFERIKRNTAQLRELKADVAEREARLREVQAELDYRTAQLSGLKLHLKRLTTI